MTLSEVRACLRAHNEQQSRQVRLLATLLGAQTGGS